MILFRYLCKEIFATLLATTLILLIIFITTQFVHYLNDAADGKITIQAVMEVMSLQVPLLVGYLLPLSLFLGLLLTFGRLYVDHEMVVLSACGVSRVQLMIVIMILSFFVMGVVGWLMLSVEPKMQWYRAKILTDAVTQASLAKIMPGRFQPLGSNSRVFYAASINDHHQIMHDVLFAQENQAIKAPDSPQRWDIVSAEKAGDLNTKDNGYFILFRQGFRYVGVPGQLKYDVIQFDRYGVRLSSTIPDISNRIEAMETSKLWLLRKTNRKAAAELQWRLAMPISVIIFALLALPLSHVNPRKGKFAQLLPAILIYIVYANLLFMGRAWIEKGVISERLGFWWIHLVLLLLALILWVNHTKWRSRIQRFGRRLNAPA